MDDLDREYFNRVSGRADPVNPTASADRWGNRVLLSNSPFLVGSGPGTATPVMGQPPAKTSATIVSTREFPLPRQLSVGVRYAINDPITNAPILPFSSVYPFFAFAQRRVGFRVRQSVDPMASIFNDEFSVGPYPEEFPLDIITARKLAIDVQMPPKGAEADFSTLWVEVIAGIVDELADRNKVQGWARNVVETPAFTPFIAASAITIPILAANPGRTQFIIQNTSTNADLLLSFGGTALWGPPIVGSIVLPRGSYAVYESPVGGFTGGVTGVWNDPVPNGGAIVTQGAA